MKIFCVLLGTVIGAGFISGAEIYLFFNRVGFLGLLGLLLSSILFFIVVYLSLINKESNYNDLVNKTISSKIIKTILKSAVTLFLIVSYFIMIAGLSSFLNENFNINYLLSSIISTSIVFFILKGNISRIEKFNLIFVPFLIFIILFLGINNNLHIPSLDFNTFDFSFLCLGILYTSYNSISLIPIILKLKDNTLLSKRKSFIISFLFSITTYFSGIIIYFLIENNPNCINASLPMLEAIKSHSLFTIFLFKFGIAFSILSTAISTEYSAVTNIVKNKNDFTRFILILNFISICTSFIGFQNLIKLFYPVFGIIGLFNFYILIKNYIIFLKIKVKY